MGKMFTYQGKTKRNVDRENNPNWKGGRIVSSHGYVKILMPEHPHADSKGYVYEHRLVMEKKEERILSSNELVHHKDENKLTNNEDNLKLEKGIAWHKVEHRKRKDLKLPDEPNSLIKCGCGCGRELLKYDSKNRPHFYLVGHNRKGKKSYDTTKIIICACGCGNTLFKYDTYGRIRSYINGHNKVRAI
jgi:hypothetical protein